MSTSTTHQQSLADASSETRPPMFGRGSYIPRASHFRRYLNRKRENRNWLYKAIDKGPYVFKNYTPPDSQTPRLQTEDVLTRDDLKHYKAKIEAMNMILISIPNEIYNSMDAFDRKTRFNNEFDQFVAEPGEALVSIYNRFAQLMNDLEQNGITFPLVTVNIKFLNCLQLEWLKEKAKQDEAGVTLIDEHNDFLVADATRMEEIKELSENICLMAIIQPANIDSDAGLSYDSTFLSEMSKNEDKYHDTVLDLEAKAKENENVVLKIGRSLQGMFMLGPKPMSFYDPNVKHGLGYENPYTLKKAISQNPKLYDASCFDDTKIHVNIRDTKDILDD
ncbi:hypothetical protein Tco_0892400 [Tanacetum coccineum]|uniref:Uncharacterized protein n=1 Tax=Tanacetum coccineum TaxID=301880 RepID=A0ABQ5C760_9ASTR